MTSTGPQLSISTFKIVFEHCKIRKNEEVMLAWTQTGKRVVNIGRKLQTNHRWTVYLATVTSDFSLYKRNEHERLYIHKWIDP